jgi:hypothetical protein
VGGADAAGAGTSAVDTAGTGLKPPVAVSEERPVSVKRGPDTGPPAAPTAAGTAVGPKVGQKRKHARKVELQEKKRLKRLHRQVGPPLCVHGACKQGLAQRRLVVRACKPCRVSVEASASAKAGVRRAVSMPCDRRSVQSGVLLHSALWSHGCTCYRVHPLEK